MMQSCASYPTDPFTAILKAIEPEGVATIRPSGEVKQLENRCNVTTEPMDLDPVAVITVLAN
jgi:hypothetical protein